MGLYKDKESGNYGIRFWYYQKEYKKIIGPDKASAQLALLEVKKEIKEAKLAGQGWDGFKKLQRDRTPRTFAEAAQDYLDERTNYKHSSLAQYRSILSCHLLPEFGKLPLRSITSSDLKKFQAKLERGSKDRKGISATRTNTVMQLLRSILDQEYREGMIDRDPSKAVRRVQEAKAIVDPLSEDELESVLNKIDEHYRPLFTTLAFTGARPNEMIALRWTDIDWKKKTIRINKGRVRGVEGKPKTKSSDRTIPMTPRVEQALINAQRAQQEKVVPIDGYIFTNKKGKPIDKHLDLIWARALKKAQLHHRPSYQLRHTFATQCIVKGFPLPFIAKILGHSTIDTLIRHYTGWIDKATKEQEELLCLAFSQQKPEGKPEGEAMQTLLRMPSA